MQRGPRAGGGPKNTRGTYCPGSAPSTWRSPSSFAAALWICAGGRSGKRWRAEPPRSLLMSRARGLASRGAADGPVRLLASGPRGVCGGAGAGSGPCGFPCRGLEAWARRILILISRTPSLPERRWHLARGPRRPLLVPASSNERGPAGPRKGSPECSGCAQKNGVTGSPRVCGDQEDVGPRAGLPRGVVGGGTLRDPRPPSMPKGLLAPGGGAASAGNRTSRRPLAFRWRPPGQ